MKKITESLLVILLLSLVLQNCVTPMGLAASNVPINPEQIEARLGVAEGSSTQWSFSPLCLFSLGHPDFDEAIKKALDSTKGDALVDIRWYKKEACLLFATWDKLVVSGTAVKLKAASEANGKKKKQ